MISVIISHYDKIDNLSIILDAFKRQSCTNFEIIISEDGNNNKTTKKNIKAYKKKANNVFINSILWLFVNKS